MTPREPDPPSGSGDAGALARRYRRLLAWYPREHRNAHEEEMLGVLLAGGAGRRRPGAAESADLLMGALRIRARHAARSFPDSTVAQALAVVSVLTPPLLLAGAAPGLHEIAWWLWHDGVSFSFLQTFPDAPGWAAWFVAGVLGLLGWRRAAATAACLAAAALSVLLTVDIGSDLFAGAGSEAPWVLLGVLGAVATTTSAGARHGLAWLGGRRYTAVLAGAAAVVASHLLGHDETSYTAARWLLPVVVVLACRPTTSVGRWVLALLALPGTAYLLTLSDTLSESTIRYLLPIAVTTGLCCLPLTRHLPRLTRKLIGAQPGEPPIPL